MQAHRKLWEIGLFGTNDYNVAVQQCEATGKILVDRWWYTKITTEVEYQIMREGSVDFDYCDPLVQSFACLFFALYFADEGEVDTIEV